MDARTARLGVGVAAAWLVFTSCAGTEPVASTSPSAATSPSPSPAPQSRSASGARTTPVTHVAGLDCTLAVALNDPEAGAEFIGTPHGGFVTFPSADLRDDPSSGLQFVGEPPKLTTVAEPMLRGQWPGPVFDPQRNRWVPVGSTDLISPDGSAYVYAEDAGGGGAISPTRIRIVTVSTGADRLLYSSGRTDEPIAWTKDGIYIVSAHFEASSGGLWLLNPRTGATRVITISGSWSFISGGAAWGFTPLIASISGITPHTVDRLDLASGKVTTWYTVKPPNYVQVVAVDIAGRPIIAVGKVDGRGVPVAAYRVFRLAAQSSAELLFTAWPPLGAGVTWLADSHGIWVAYPDILGQIWLYADGMGYVKVAETGKFILNVAGPCR